MDKVNFNYSMKNIPLSSHKNYLIELIHSVAKFVANLDKRVDHFLNHNKNQHEKKERYGFNSTKAPPNCPELDQLKDMLYDLVIGVKFRNHSNHFQENLKRDIRKIEAERRMLIAADKTTNHYYMNKEVHDDLLERSLNKDYKKANEAIVRDIIAGDKKITEELEIADRAYCTSKRQSFISLKDHNIRNLKISNLNIQNLKIRNRKIRNLKIGNLTIGNLKIGNLKICNLKISNLKICNLKIGI